MTNETQEQTQETVTIAPREVAGQFSFSVKLDQSSDKSLNFTGFIYADDTEEDANTRLDFIGRLISRQETKASIPVLKQHLEQRLVNLENYLLHVRGVTSQREELKKIPRAKMNSTQKKLLDDSQNLIDHEAINVDALKKEIDKLRTAIAEAEKKVG